MEEFALQNSPDGREIGLDVARERAVSVECLFATGDEGGGGIDPKVRWTGVESDDGIAVRLIAEGQRADQADVPFGFR